MMGLEEWSWRTLLRLHAESRLLQIIDTAPLFLGIFARFAGIRQDNINRLADVYHQFVPKEFFDLLGISNPTEIAIGLQKDIEVATAFVDIRNFTTIAERLGRDVVMTLLNNYYREIYHIVKKHHGFIGKFLGDGVMTIFPRSADDALRASVEVVKFVSTRTISDGQRSMKLDVGIGVAYGLVCIGTVGSDVHMDTTIVGDVVNTAARLQGLTKKWHTRILYAHELHDALSTHSREYSRFLAKVKVKGKQRTVTIYECYENDDDAVRNAKYTHRDIFHKAVMSYYERDFSASLDAFLDYKANVGDDQAADVYLAHYADRASKVKQKVEVV